MTDFEARMQAFRARFVERAAEDAARVRRAWTAGDLQALRGLAHGLVGNAGMFGFHDIGAAARAVEEAVDAGLAPDALSPLVDRLVASLPGG